jgi:WD40 repeat protein
MCRILSLLALVGLLATTGRAAAPPVPPLLDDHGDPLPDGAVARLGTLRWRAGVFVPNFVWSPDGRWIATADGHRRTVRLWDAATGRVVRTFWGHRDSVNRVAFSPDGKRLVSASSDRSARVWEVKTGKALLRLAGLEEDALQAVFTRDGKEVAVLDRKGLLLRYDAGTGKELKRIHPGPQLFFAYTLSPRGDWVARFLLDTQNRNNKLVIQNASTGKQLHEFPLGDRLGVAAFSPDSKLVAMRVYRAGLEVWRLSDGKKSLSLSADEGGVDGRLLFTPDSKALLGDHAPGKSRLWDLATGKRLQSYLGMSHSQHPRAISPDGKRIVNIDHQNRLRFWDVAKGQEVSPGLDGMEGPVFALAFSSDGKRLLSGGGWNSAVRLWDIRTRKVVRSFAVSDDPHQSVYSVALSRDGKKAAAVGGGVVVVWDTDTGKVLLRPAPLKDAQLFGVLFSSDGKTLLATGHHTGGIVRWDLQTGEPLEPLRSDLLKSARDLHLSADGKTLAVNGPGVMTFWSMDGKFQRSVKVTDNPHTWLSRLSPDGKRIAAFDFRGNVVLSAAQDGKVVRTWRGAALDSNLQFSPDGKLLVGIAGRAIHAWRTDTGQALPPFVADPEYVRGLAFSPDGKWLATSGYSSVILLWNVEALPRLSAYRMPVGEWEQCWDTLGGEQAFHITRAQTLLHAGGNLTVARVRETLTPPPVDAKRAEGLLRIVNGDADTAADKAAADLVRLGPGVRPLIDKALQGKLDPDARLRLIVALSKLPKPDPAEEALRAPRVVSVLKQIGTKEAKALLADLAAGKAGRTWTTAAKDSKP